MAEFALRNISNPVVMAILNVTPDSFFSGNRWNGQELFKNKVITALNDGAEILDVGGYSSRPGAEDVSEQEELNRVSKAIEIIRSVSDSIPISVDTFRSSVVRSVVKNFGQIIVNDITAGELDSKMLETVAQLGTPYIAMHMKGTPQDMQQRCDYNNIINELDSYFANKIELFNQLGITDFALDPGFGFAKSTQQNYELLSQLHKLTHFGVPLLVGISRISMIYRILNSTPEDALSGTIALNWESLRQGAKILRVHDVKPAVECVRLFNYFSRNNND